MGLISKTVKVKWNGRTKKQYESLGYVFTNMGDEFEVKVEDLLKGSNVKVYGFCDCCKKELEWSYKQYNESKKEDGTIYCNKCSKVLYSSEKSCKTKLKKSKSMAQYILDNFPDKEIGQIWDYEKNTVDPYEISYKSGKKCWFICQEKDYHGSYETQCCHFSNGCKCPFCTHKNGKLHYKDSLGQFIVDNYGQDFLDKIWSNKNKKTPFEISPYTAENVWWDCPNNKHESFLRNCRNSIKCNFRCPDCVNEEKNSLLEKNTKLFLIEKGYDVKTEYECSLFIKNPKKDKKGRNNILPFDNEIILENGKHLIIEVHGEQHYILLNKSNTWLKKNGEKLTPEEYLHQRKLYDRYKRIKCIQAGYEYLELPYWTFDNNDTYKKLIDDKIKEILNKK